MAVTSCTIHTFEDLDVLLNAKCGCTNLYPRKNATCDWLIGSIPTEIGNFHDLSDKLKLRKQSLQGAIPSELGRMRSLQSLDISCNSLKGEIPSELGQLQHLESIELSFNSLFGSTPSELGKLLGAREFRMENNFLFGTIPSELGSSNRWRNDCPYSWFAVFDLSCNRITGSIPSEIGVRDSCLCELNLGRNSLVGSIPSELGKLIAIEQFIAAGNTLKGGISAFRTWEYLNALRLNDNLLDGSIATSIGYLVRGIRFEFGSNCLEGTIPTEVGKERQLNWFDAEYNSLKGSLPLLTADGLIAIALANNSLTGSLPTYLWKLRKLHYFDFSTNHLQGTIGIEILSARSLSFLWGSSNSLHGALPSELSRIQAPVISLPWNHLEGSLPRGLLIGVRVLHGNRLRGRLQVPDGPDAIVLTLHNNWLGGSVPRLRFEPWVTQDCSCLSALTLHGNHFSCVLPENAFSVDQQCVSTIKYSSTLIGNLFSGPLPSWIPSTEKDPILYRSPNKELLGFIASLAVGAVALWLSMWWMFGLAGIGYACGGSRVLCCVDHCLLRSFLQVAMLSICGFLPLYMVGSQWYECSKFPANFSNLQHAFAEWMVGGCFVIHYCLVCCFVKNQGSLSQAEKKTRLHAPGLFAHIFALSAWVALSLICAVPSTFYTLMKSLPKENLVSDLLGESRALVFYDVSAVTGSFVLSFVLPHLIGCLFGLGSLQLESWCRSICQWVLPSLMVLIMHENCFGLWRLMWSVCSSIESQEQLDVPNFSSRYSVLIDRPLLTGAEMCRVPAFLDVAKNGKCARSIINVMGSLLAQKSISEALLLPCILLWKSYICWRLKQQDFSTPWLRHCFARAEPHWHRLLIYHTQCLEMCSVWGTMDPALQPLYLLGYVTNLWVYRAGMAQFSENNAEVIHSEISRTTVHKLMLGFILSMCMSLQISYRCASLLCTVPFLALIILRGSSRQRLAQEGVNANSDMEVELAVSSPAALQHEEKHTLEALFHPKLESCKSHA